MALLSGNDLFQYNRLPYMPTDRPLGDLLNSLSPITPVPAGTRHVYVDTVHGNDNNDGLTTATAFRTIQYAVSALKLPLVQTWATGDDRTIHVIYTAGMPDITEQIVVPPHAGSGNLIILAEEEVLFSSLVLSGALAAVAGTVTRQTMSFTTAPMTPASLNRDAFVRLHDRTLAPDAFEATLDDLPIFSNLAGSCVVIAGEPGTLTAFEIGAGSVVDIVRPKIRWSLPTNTNAGLYSGVPVITNYGSPLIVSGFYAAAPSDASGRSHYFLSNATQGSDLLLGPRTVLNRCKALSGPAGELWTALAVGDCCLAGVLVPAASLSYVWMQARLAFVYNTDINIANTFNTIEVVDVDELQLIGLNVSGCNLFFIGGRYTVYMDINIAGGVISSGALVISGPAQVDIYALSIINAGAVSGISANGSHGGFGSVGIGIYNQARVIGSAGNTGVGCLLGVFSSLHLYGGAGPPTLSGTGGDVRVGALAPRAWAAGAQTDPTDLCRLD